MEWIPLIDMRVDGAPGTKRAVEIVRRAALEKVAALRPADESNALMRVVRLIASELGENLSKYNNWHHQERPRFFMVASDDGQHLKISTENRFDPHEGHVEALQGVLRKLETASPAEAFRKRLIEAGFEALEAATRLGVLRIASEARSTVEVSVESNDLLRVTVTVNLDEIVLAGLS